MMQFLNGMIVSRCIGLAAELGIADLLQDGLRSASSLADATGTQPGPLYRLLRMLAGLGIFAEQADRRFANTPLSETLRKDTPDSVRDYARWLCTDLHWRTLGDLDYTVRTGEPSIVKDHPGKTPFDVLFGDPEASVVFDEAMTGLSVGEGAAIVQAYDFSPYERVVDVGGGHGYLATLIARNSPRTRVTVYDLQHVVEGARSRIESGGLSEQVGAVAGSFLEAVPGPADLCVLKHIVHGFDDERARRILSNCRHALRDGGHVLVCEMLVTPGPEGVPARVMDIEMLAGPGGRERTKAEYSELFEEAGLRLERVIETRTPLYLLEGAVSG